MQLPEPGPRSAGVDRLRNALALAALASPVLIFLSAFLFRSTPLRFILDGPVLGTKDVPNFTRNALELASFRRDDRAGPHRDRCITVHDPAIG